MNWSQFVDAVIIVSFSALFLAILRVFFLYMFGKNESVQNKIPKLCKDCAFCGEGDYPRCQNENCQSLDLVMGKNKQDYCSTVRIYTCGKEAKLFQPKS